MWAYGFIEDSDYGFKVVWWGLEYFMRFTACFYNMNDSFSFISNGELSAVLLLALMLGCKVWREKKNSNVLSRGSCALLFTCRGYETRRKMKKRERRRNLIRWEMCVRQSVAYQIEFIYLCLLFFHLTLWTRPTPHGCSSRRDISHILLCFF